MEELAEDFGDRVTFVILYTLEAHPVDSASPYTGEVWDPWVNRIARARWRDTETTEERREHAAEAAHRLDLAPSVLVDPVGDLAWTDLGRAPSAAFVVGADGTIVARQVWVDPPALRTILTELLEIGSPPSL